MRENVLRGQSEGGHSTRSRLASALLVTAMLVVAPAALLHAQTAPAQRWVATWGTAQQSYRAPAVPGGRGAAPAAAPGVTAPPVTTPAATAPAVAQPTAVLPTPQSAPAVGTPSANAPAQPAAGRSAPQRRYPVPPALPGLNNQTVRMIVRTSIGGQTVRIRLSQAYGAAAVMIGAAHIAVRAEGSAIVAGSDRTLTFSGTPTATIYAGQILLSDPVRLDVKPSADLAVSLFFPGETGSPTNHTFGLRPTYVAREGDATAAPALTDLVTTTQSYYWLTGVDVLAPPSAGTLVTFGDSITDGDQSTPDTIGMWPALLSARLQRSPQTAKLGIGVVNAGISGNRVLGDNGGGLARFVRDALSVPGVRWISVLEGINDITAATRAPQAGSTFNAATLIAAYTQMIELAHLQGVKMIGCTITPYGESNVYTEQGEAIRQAVNTWIRTGGAFDAVFDFDAATRDAKVPTRFRAEADSPDMLHPANSGYALMADSIDLSVFTAPRATPARGRR